MLFQQIYEVISVKILFRFVLIGIIQKRERALAGKYLNIIKSVLS